MTTNSAIVFLILLCGCAKQDKPLHPSTERPEFSYTPVADDREAFEFVKAHNCQHRDYHEELVWSNKEKKLVPSPAFHAYDCDGVGSSIYITEAR